MAFLVLFLPNDLPPSIDACNARGAWGTGVALAFKQKHPHAFSKYNAHCLSPPPGSKLSVKQHQANLVGTSLLIPPSDASNQRQASKTPHYIACLFTSLDYGKRVSPTEEILENTENALKDLAIQIAEMREAGEEVGNCYAVRINSGKFGVEWQKTKAVLEAGELDITVLRPEGEEKADGAGTAVGGRLVQPSMTSGGGKGSTRSEAAKTKAGTLFHEQNIGVKRKRKADVDRDQDSVRERAKGKQSVLANRAIATRKMLGLDG